MWMMAAGALSAQPTVELQKLAQNYKATTSISYNMAYTYYNGHDGKVAGDVATGFYQQQGNKYYCKAGTVEYLYDGKKLLYIDHEDQEIALLEMAKKPAPPSFTPGACERSR